MQISDQVGPHYMRKHFLAILHLIVEGTEYEGLTELLWGKSLTYEGKSSNVKPSLASPDYFIKTSTIIDYGKELL